MGIDIIDPLTPSFNGHRYIIVAIDYLTKWAEARPLQFVDSTEVASFIYEDIITWHGIPKTIIMDNGTHFINAYIGSLCKKFKIQYNYISSYNS